MNGIERYGTFELQLAQLEALGNVEVCITHKSVRTRDRFVGVHVNRVEIGGDGLLTTVSGYGDSIQSAVADLYGKLTTLPDDKYVVRNGWSDTREAFRFNDALGTWLRVEEAFV